MTMRFLSISSRQILSMSPGVSGELLVSSDIKYFKLEPSDFSWTGSLEDANFSKELRRQQRQQFGTCHR
jgi:hypothetical protein